MTFKTEDEFARIVDILSKTQMKSKPGFTFKQAIRSYPLDMGQIPAVVWYDNQPTLEYCYKEWLDENGYVENNLFMNAVPEDLFEL